LYEVEGLRQSYLSWANMVSFFVKYRRTAAFRWTKVYVKKFAIKLFLFILASLMILVIWLFCECLILHCEFQTWKFTYEYLICCRVSSPLCPNTFLKEYSEATHIPLVQHFDHTVFHFEYTIWHITYCCILCNSKRKIRKIKQTILYVRCIFISGWH